MPKKHFLTQSQLESLTSPTRLAIVQRLDIDRQATAREIAHRMGRAVTSLYHHLKELEDVGLLQVVAERKGARRPEAVYATVADKLSSAEAIKTAKGKEAYARAAARVAEAGARALSAAIAHGSPKFEGEKRDAMTRFYVLRADDKKLARINQLLNRLEEEAGQSCDGGEEIRLTVLLSPTCTKK